MSLMLKETEGSLDDDVLEDGTRGDVNRAALGGNNDNSSL